MRLAARAKSAHLVENLVRAHEAAAVDRAVAGDENIRKVFAPDEAVVEITMSAVLIAAECVRLRLVINIHVLRRAENGRASVNEQMDVALQMNRAAQISSGGNENRAATGLRAGVNRLVNRRAVEVLAVADRAKTADVEIILAGGFGGVHNAAQAKHQGRAIKDE